MPERFVTGSRVVHTATFGDLRRPTITDTETGRVATFVRGAHVVAIARVLNNAPSRVDQYVWEEGADDA